jgi:hypothetical protein
VYKSVHLLGAVAVSLQCHPVEYATSDIGVHVRLFGCSMLYICCVITRFALGVKALLSCVKHTVMLADFPTLATLGVTLHNTV